MLMCLRGQRRFAVTDSTPAVARHFATDAIGPALGADGSDVVEDAELVTGEFVTNAVLAGARSVDMLVEIHFDRLELAVTDDGSGWPVLRPPDPYASGGRGLQIVAALATRWGVTVGADRRTTVWAELACDPLHTRALHCSSR